ncbi:hypothetical protein Bcep1808_2130 [Burkholderia vietnamiensis G4]|uniref:Uncharacterized protein n=1 Tax=Burkholderia vietnamiensis (strain G4 / LMG 22486) TaxID=269482 RepID=A4JFS9_BURVG|nr:hypothetical protein Bcep1808_2130 [Burkholderia vietnamiensis G4]
MPLSGIENGERAARRSSALASVRRPFPGGSIRQRARIPSRDRELGVGVCGRIVGRNRNAESLAARATASAKFQGICGRGNGFGQLDRRARPGKVMVERVGIVATATRGGHADVGERAIEQALTPNHESDQPASISRRVVGIAIRDIGEAILRLRRHVSKKRFENDAEFTPLRTPSALFAAQRVDTRLG